MLVSLFTTRMILDYLGVEDFGIYNIVGGVVVLLGFFQNSINNSIERFITYQIGRGDNDLLSKTFSMSFISVISISIAVFFLSETIGLWFINFHLNITEDRMLAVNFLYQFSILTFVITILRSPYHATIIAHEQMSFFAIITIIEAILKLGIIFFIPIINIDPLIIYPGLLLLVTIFGTIFYKHYCNRKYKITKFKFYWDKVLFKKILSFSVYSMLSGTANVAARQGGNILLNIYSGIVANASFGIANQVGAAVSAFATNLLIAFNPQIIKRFANNDIEGLNKLIFRSSTFSFYMILIIAIPFLINTKLILSNWLHDVPEYSVVFCQLIIIYQMIDMIQAPLGTLISATGNIRNYQIWLSLLLILNLPISWYLIHNGFSIYWIFFIRIFLNIITSIIRVIYIKYFVEFPSLHYFISVVVKASIVTIISFGISLFFKHYFNSDLLGTIYNSIISIFSTIIIIYLVGLSKNERSLIKNWLNTIIN